MRTTINNTLIIICFVLFSSSCGNRKIKENGVSKENISLESEAAKDGSVIWTYKKGNYTFVFDNGSDSNGKVYMLDVLYNSAIKN